MEGPTSTGIPNRKLAMWTFIGSECMLFGTLIATAHDWDDEARWRRSMRLLADEVAPNL